MADNRPTLTVAPRRKPSFLNAGALVGLVTGGFLAGAVPFAAPIGLAAGAWLGKRKMQKEQEFGKQVTPPSGWNLGTFFGGASGVSIGATVGLLTLAIFGATTGVGFIALGALGACTAIGGWIGGKIGKQFQKREYKAAEREVMERGEFIPPRERGQAPQQGHGAAVSAPHQAQGQARSTSLAQASQQLPPEQLAQLQALAAQGQRMAPSQPESMTDKLGHSRPVGPQQR